MIAGGQAHAIRPSPAGTSPDAVTWCRLPSGVWGVRGPTGALVAGCTVDVLKRSGEVSQVTIDRVVLTEGEIALASIKGKVAHASGHLAPRRIAGVCPKCKGPMPRHYTSKGYQCDRCADLEEGCF